MVLRSDRDLAGAQIFHRLSRATMSKLEFECRSAKSEAEHLMPKANPEDRFFAHQTAHGFMCIGKRGRITWSVGKKNSVRIKREHLVRRCRCGNHRDGEA